MTILEEIQDYLEVCDDFYGFEMIRDENKNQVLIYDSNHNLIFTVYDERFYQDGITYGKLEEFINMVNLMSYYVRESAKKDLIIDQLLDSVMCLNDVDFLDCDV